MVTASSTFDEIKDFFTSWRTPHGHFYVLSAYIGLKSPILAVQSSIKIPHKLSTFPDNSHYRGSYPTQSRHRDLDIVSIIGTGGFQWRSNL